MLKTRAGVDRLNAAKGGRSARRRTTPTMSPLKESVTNPKKCVQFVVPLRVKKPLTGPLIPLFCCISILCAKLVTVMEVKGDETEIVTATPPGPSSSSASSSSSSSSSTTTEQQKSNKAVAAAMKRAFEFRVRHIFYQYDRTQGDVRGKIKLARFHRGWDETPPEISLFMYNPPYGYKKAPWDDPVSAHGGADFGLVFEQAKAMTSCKLFVVAAELPYHRLGEARQAFEEKGYSAAPFYWIKKSGGINKCGGVMHDRVCHSCCSITHS